MTLLRQKDFSPLKMKKIETNHIYNQNCIEESEGVTTVREGTAKINNNRIVAIHNERSSSSDVYLPTCAWGALQTDKRVKASVVRFHRNGIVSEVKIARNQYDDGPFFDSAGVQFSVSPEKTYRFNDSGHILNK